MRLKHISFAILISSIAVAAWVAWGLFGPTLSSEKKYLYIEQSTPSAQLLSSIKEKEYLTNKEVMILLSISRTSLYRMIKKKYLSSVKVGLKVMIRRKDIDTLFNDQISNNKNEPISLNSDAIKAILGLFAASLFPPQPTRVSTFSFPVRIS